MRHEYRMTSPSKWAAGSKYGPLQTDGTDYLCPDCGGYGKALDGGKCGFCKGKETIPLDDKRIVAEDPRSTA